MAPAAAYDRLSGLDESFLHLERPETPMHVGAMAVLEREPFYDARGRFRLDDGAGPRCFSPAAHPPIPQAGHGGATGQGRPVWVDHEGFDIADHVRVTALAAPGTRRQLRELAERLTMQVLDRRRPLWELWFVEGVDHGEHVGLVHKSHHTLTDGISGVDIATVLLDFSAEPTVLPPDEWVAAAAPDPTRLMLDSARERLTRPSELVGTARHLADAPPRRWRAPPTSGARSGRWSTPRSWRRGCRSTRRSGSAAASRPCASPSTT